MKILLIDDEAHIIDFYIRLAKTHGFDDIETASSGEEALTKIILERYDLITVDIHMPGLSGLEILAMLRNMSSHAIIAVISGYIPDELPQEVLDCTDVMMSKPISMDSLVGLLKDAAEIRRIRDHILELGDVTVLNA